MQQQTKHLPYLDGWRGVAILFVLISHFGKKYHISWFGEIGVQMFFVLSGYLMSNLLFLKKVELPTFFWRRMSRIMPAFIVFILTMAAYSNLPGESPPSFAELVAALTFTRTYFPADMNIWEMSWYVDNIWSLNVEEHSYIYLAGLTLAARGKWHYWVALVLLFASVVAILAITTYYQSSPPAGASPWHIRSECAALGLVAAAAIRVSRQRVTISFGRLDYLVTVGCLTIGALCYIVYQHKGVHLTIAPLAFAVGINYLDRAPLMLRSLLSSRVLCWFGTCSFSLYLWQQPFYRAVIAQQTPEWRGISAALLVGTLSYYLLESPARKRLNAAGWRTAKPTTDPTRPASPS